MTKSKRKALDDSLAQAFVYGENEKDETPPPSTKDPYPQKISEGTSNDLIRRFKAEKKEPTVRFTADLPQSIHRKLSILAAQTGKKKVEIVRMLLVEALDSIE